MFAIGMSYDYHWHRNVNHLQYCVVLIKVCYVPICISRTISALQVYTVLRHQQSFHQSALPFLMLHILFAYIKTSTTIESHLPTVVKVVFILKLAISGLFFLYLRLFITVDSKHMFDLKFAHDWIRTADNWCRKRPLYQLSDDPCPSKGYVDHGSVARKEARRGPTSERTNAFDKKK